MDIAGHDEIYFSHGGRDATVWSNREKRVATLKMNHVAQRV
jgi:hypothetical protein